MILMENLQKPSALSSSKINKYEYFTDDEILPSNQKQIIEQTKFTCSPLGRAFQKQTKTIKDQGEKEIKAIKNQRVIKKKSKYMFIMRKRVKDFKTKGNI